MSTSTIGTSSRNYSTISGWEASLPANLVTDGNSYTGECYNDSEFTAGVAFSAHTTDATHTITVTAAAGQSFQDNASVRTNALRYTQANGVAIKNSTGYTHVFNVTNSNTYLTISRIQMLQNNVNGSAGIFDFVGSSVPVHIYKDLLIEHIGVYWLINVEGNSSKVTNAVLIKRNVSTVNAAIRLYIGNVTVLGSTIVRASNYAAGGTGIERYVYNGGTPVIQSCAVFGFTTAVGGAASCDTTNSKNNGTDQASGFPGTTANQYSITYANAFVTTSDAGGTHDFTTKSGTALDADGFKDATNAPNDITATLRAATPTIGAWELAATGIAFDAASNSGYQAAQSSYSWNHTCTGTNLYLTVGIAMLSISQTVTSITYNSVNLVLLGVRSSITGACRIELWGLVAPATGTNSIAVTLSGSIASAGCATSFTSVNQSLPTEAYNSGQATNVGAADATVNVTTVADNDWTVDIVATDDTAITVGTGQTSRANVTGAGGSGAMSTKGPNTPPGAFTMYWTNIGALSTWSIGSIALRSILASGAKTFNAFFLSGD